MCLHFMVDWAIITGDVRSLKISQQGQNVIYTTPARSVSYVEAAFNSTIHGVLVFGTSLSDNLDLFPSPVRALVFGGAGDDVVTGSQLGDTFFAGTGSDRLYGRGGADTIFAGMGAQSLLRVTKVMTSFLAAAMETNLPAAQGVTTL